MKVDETRIIVAQSRLDFAYLRELWEARTLIFVLIGRDVRVRYKQTLIGLGWVILQPLTSVLAYSFMFSYIARIPSEGVPYPIFLLTALLPWQFVARLATDGSQSVTVNANLVGKIYFPRLVLPLTVLGSSLVDLLVGLLIAILAMALFGYLPSVRILALPLLVVYAAMIGLAIAVLVAPLDVYYRDVRFAMPLGLQIVLFLSPVLYSVALVPERLRWLFELNPIAVMANGVRWCLLGHGTFPARSAVIESLLLVAALLAIGLWAFVRAEARFADRI
jgi:lipopolysaccharide transport system permease protein